MAVYIDLNWFNRTCPQCQADVHGMGVQTCPECGGSMVPSCMTCGYDLAGLPRDGLCPECSTAVEKSYAPDLLENRSIPYLMRIRSGLVIVIFGLLAHIPLGIAELVVITATTGLALLSPGTPASALWSPTVQVVLQAAGFALSLLVLFGWWRITTPDPAGAGTDFDVRPRQILRIAAILQSAAVFTGLAASVVMVSRSTLTVSINPPMVVTGLVGGLAWIVQFFAVMVYLQWLARRVPDTKLYTAARRFIWLGPSLCVVGAFCLGLGPLIALVLYLVMLITAHKHLSAILFRLGAP